MREQRSCLLPLAILPILSVPVNSSRPIYCGAMRKEGRGTLSHNVPRPLLLGTLTCRVLAVSARSAYGFGAFAMHCFFALCAAAIASLRSLPFFDFAAAFAAA